MPSDRTDPARFARHPLRAGARAIAVLSLCACSASSPASSGSPPNAGAGGAGAGTDAGTSALGAPREGIDSAAFERGKALFTKTFSPPGCYNDVSCSNCHAIPAAGGSGDYAHRSYGVGTCRFPAPGHIPAGAPYRLAPPVFGLGLLDPSAIPDSALHCGLQGRMPHTSDEHHAVARFGQKPLVETVTAFCAGAAFIEMGLTNHGGIVNEPLEDRDGGPVLMSDAEVDDLGAYVGGLAPPARGALPSDAVFVATGCEACHQLPYGTDLCVHDMGAGLDDGSGDGSGTPTGVAGWEWRTMHLMGVRLRVTLLHDGRATTIDAAIRAHGGEAAPAALAYARLSDADRSALLAFVEAL